MLFNLKNQQLKNTKSDLYKVRLFRFGRTVFFTFRFTLSNNKTFYYRHQCSIIKLYKADDSPLQFTPIY